MGKWMADTAATGGGGKKGKNALGGSAGQLRDLLGSKEMQQATSLTGDERDVRGHAKAMDILDRDRSYELFNKMFGVMQPGAAGGAAGSATSGAQGLGIEDRLRSLLDDPESIKQTGAYQFRVGQGQEALQRSLGARGLLGSGNRLMELTKYGQDMASQEYGDQFSRLADLLGKEQSYKSNMFGSLANVLGAGALGRGGTDQIWGAYGQTGAARYGQGGQLGSNLFNAYGQATAAQAAADAQQAAQKTAAAAQKATPQHPNVDLIGGWPRGVGTTLGRGMFGALS